MIKCRRFHNLKLLFGFSLFNLIALSSCSDDSSGDSLAEIDPIAEEATDEEKANTLLYIDDLINVLELNNTKTVDSNGETSLTKDSPFLIFIGNAETVESDIKGVHQLEHFKLKEHTTIQHIMPGEKIYEDLTEELKGKVDYINRVVNIGTTFNYGRHILGTATLKDMLLLMNLGNGRLSTRQLDDNDPLKQAGDFITHKRYGLLTLDRDSCIGELVGYSGAELVALIATVSACEGIIDFSMGTIIACIVAGAETGSVACWPAGVAIPAVMLCVGKFAVSVGALFKLMDAIHTCS